MEPLTITRELWAGLQANEDIRTLAVRLGLPEKDGITEWRKAIVFIASQPEFLTAAPRKVHEPSWRAWLKHDSSPRAQITVLRRIVAGERTAELPA